VDAHHIRFAQHLALGRKVSDEFTVPLCRAHHREVHRCGNEAAWWHMTGIDPMPAARALWLETHPLGANKAAVVAADPPSSNRAATRANPRRACRIGNDQRSRETENGVRHDGA